MDDHKADLDTFLEQQRGAAIIEGTHGDIRHDGYTNILNRYGTIQDNSTAYQYAAEPFADDLELTRLYEGNGLFTKIIDRPAEEAVKHGLDVDFGDEEISEYIESKMDDLEYEDKFATAEKWARLYGGSIIVMLADDGRGLEEPLDMSAVRSIEELRVFERSIVQPDYTSLYRSCHIDPKRSDKAFGEPEYYQVTSQYGYFTVHRSRCLVFRNGRLPEQTTNSIYRYWGIPEYVKIKRALRECITSHEDGVKLLERSVQAIYKMKNLANMLATLDGEDKVLRRLQVIDMARGILNSMAIDADGEDYDFKTLQMAGVKDVLDATCNMLSAVTNIPQTILFGRSPAGMNATGESDMENFYNMVENIQKQNMKKNTRTVIDLIIRQGILDGEIAEAPKYKVKFKALWSLSEAEQAAVDQTKAQTQYTKAQTAQIYMDSSVIDPSEVRKSLAAEGDMEIEEILSGESDGLDIPDDTFDVPALASEVIHISDTSEKEDAGKDDVVISIRGTGESHGPDEKLCITGIGPQGDGKVVRISMDNGRKRTGADGEGIPAAAVLIINDGRFLCASRSDGEGICGPGGHVEAGEAPEEAASREAVEEFDIIPHNLIPIGVYKGSPGLYLPSMVYFTDQFTGTPKADGDEMLDARWLTLQELENERLFPPFEASVKMLINLLTGGNGDVMITSEMDGGPGSGNFGHGGRPGKTGGSLPKAGSGAISKALSDGKISTKLDGAKQSKHRKGSDRYNKAVNSGSHVSTIDIGDKELQGLIKRSAGTGTGYSNGRQFKETIDAGKTIGTYADVNGGYHKTSRITIHYSKTGCHAVPARPKDRGAT